LLCTTDTPGLSLWKLQNNPAGTDSVRVFTILKLDIIQTELWSYVKVEVATLGSQSLVIVLMVSMDVKQHSKKNIQKKKKKKKKGRKNVLLVLHKYTCYFLC